MQLTETEKNEEAKPPFFGVDMVTEAVIEGNEAWSEESTTTQTYNKIIRLYTHLHMIIEHER